MVKASGQIEKELGLLQQRTEDMSGSLDKLYDGYLKALGSASAQQLMSAVYHLCTQAYPDRFLALSWKERNQLQTSLQTLAAQIQVQLDEQRSQVKKNSRKPSKSSGLAFLQRLLEARSSGAVIQAHKGDSADLLDKLSEIAQLEPANEDSDPNLDLSTEAELDLDKSFDAAGSSSINDSEELSTEDPTASETDNDSRESDDIDFEMDIPEAEQRLTISDEEDLLGALEVLAKRANSSEEETPEAPLAPVHLMRQQMLMEKAIQDVFRSISEATNELLQKAAVMPNFPKALMAAAVDSRGFGESTNAVPNVVKVSVRVMHGEATFGEAEFEEEDSEEADFDSREDTLDGFNRDEEDWQRSQRRYPDERKGRNQRRANQSKDWQKNSREPGRSSESSSNSSPESRRRRRRESEASSYRRSQRSPSRSSRPFIPKEAIEIEAFPEFAVINLQLSDVEFADPRVSVWRGRLRKELSHLKQLGLRYKKTQKSLETAQAEDAWRSSWTSLEES